MRLRRSTMLLSLALLGVAAAAGESGTWAAFSATTASGATSFSAAADWTAPAVSASVLAHSSSGPGIKAGGTYRVYANVTDTGNPASGVAGVTAGVGSISAGQTAVALTSCSSSCTVGGTTYGYKSAPLTADAGLAAGSVSYTVGATDSAGNASSPASFPVSVDNTAPGVTAAALAHSTAGTGIKASGTYFVYANASDAGSGVSSVTADVSSITTGQTAVSLSPCSSSCTVGPTTYGYKSAQLTADAALVAGGKSYTVSAADAAGNTSSPATFSVTVDNLPPSATDVQTANGTGQTGRPEAGDTLTLTFSEQVDPSSILSGWSGSSANVVVRISSSGGAGGDVVTFWNSTNTTQLPLGSIDLGKPGYVGTGSTIAFGASGTPSTMLQSGATLTFTLGTPASTANRVAASTTMTWTSSTAPTDLAGNAATGNPVIEGGGNDREF